MGLLLMGVFKNLWLVVDNFVESVWLIVVLEVEVFMMIFVVCFCVNRFVFRVD